MLARISKQVSAGTFKLTARMPAKTRRKLKRQKSGKIRLAVKVTDAAGNSSKASAVIRLRG